jgi:putative ATPase
MTNFTVVVRRSAQDDEVYGDISIEQGCARRKGSKSNAMSLFDTTPVSAASERGRRTAPLAERMRPRTLEEFVGQEHLLAPGKPLRLAIEKDDPTSMIFWGPPGTGKTTLAKIIAQMTQASFIEFSAVMSGIKEIKNVMVEAEKAAGFGSRTILFVDEIHRFNKAQQDAFLPYVERGTIRLIGATTENPSFEINAALLSRCRVYTLVALTEGQIVGLLRRALADAERGLGASGVEAEDEALATIASYSSGDARNALNALDVAAKLAVSSGPGEKLITKAVAAEALQRRVLLYDKKGEQHYDIISALHKSVRNSDPDAAMYWLGRMLEAGEDPMYVARRVVRMAVEDIGLAAPEALNLCLSAKDAMHFLGHPEGELALAQAVVYLALAPKSNAVYTAYGAVLADIEATAAEPVPLHLRNAPTKLMKELDYGRDYQYAHDVEGLVADMECLPAGLVGRRYYHPTNEGREKLMAQRMDEIARIKAAKRNG